MRQGRVRVNGEIIREPGFMCDPRTAVIEADGEVVPKAPPEHTYILLHKPAKYVTTVRDPEGRPAVLDLLPKDVPRVYPAGRLDWDTEGALLLTNDGALAHRLTHPASSVPKVYEVKVRGVPTAAHLAALRSGIRLADGAMAPRAHVIPVRGTPLSTWLRITLTSGQNRIVRRMCEALGYEIQRLRRVSFAGLDLAGLGEGEWRLLAPKEVKRLWGAVQSGGKALLQAAAADEEVAVRAERQRNRPRAAAPSVKKTGKLVVKLRKTPIASGETLVRPVRRLQPRRPAGAKPQGQAATAAERPARARRGPVRAQPVKAGQTGKGRWLAALKAEKEAAQEALREAARRDRKRRRRGD